ncbi:gliding motility-associated C-terminal domain-containing protein [Flavobacteriales bacterium]|nr:gliding motility-associated C-terminal domain-containing protein [Flavobacteriales bacterium]
MSASSSICKFLVVIICILAFNKVGFAQPGCPNITTGPNQSVDCNINCTDLTASVFETGESTSYAVSSIPYAPPAPFTGGIAQLINTDDIFGGIVNLPFNFCFYGNVYSQVVIGANGLISFDITEANQICAFAFTDAIPSANLYTNCIMGAYHDIDPSVSGEISYLIQGVSPCRMFVVSFNDVAHFSCDCTGGIFGGGGCSRTTQQIVIYETTNVIEVYVEQKETCTDWNDGNAVIGIQDATGASGLTPAGRNTGPWTANNEGWRFTPDGAPNFTVEWYDGSSNIIGSGLTVNVCPAVTTTYTAEATYTNCDQSVITVSDVVTVTQNSTVSVSVTPTTAALCTGQSVDLTASSTNPGINYTWSPAAGLSGTTGATVIASPSTTTLYTVAANDGNCSTSANVNITVVDIQTPSSSTDASCAGDDGTATVTPSGGIAPYTYAWNTTPVQTTQTATALAAGNYDVTVTDATGCTASETVTVSLTLGALSPPTMSSTDAVCTTPNGTATATAVDGNAPYTYAWDTSPIQTTQTAIDLAAGTYNVVLTDNGGCQSTASVIVGVDPGSLTANVIVFSNVSCNGNCDGTATVDALNGAAPLIYLWDDPSAQSTQTASNLCAGTYDVGVADANGCLATAQIVISEPTAVTVNAIMDLQSNCGNPDGQASATANGGTVALDYAYTWNSTPTQSGTVATGLEPGIYTVTAIDNNGCSGSADIEVTSTPGFSASISSFTDASCFQNCDGTATALASNVAIAPLSYSWDSTPTQNTAVATNLCAGTYDVTITDDLNCVATASAIIGQPTMVSTSVAASASPICIGESANLTGTISGGTQPYATTIWTSTPNDPSLITTQQNPTVSPVITTDYSLVATDANGCASIPKTVTIAVLDPLTLTVTRPLNVDTGICPYDFATLDVVATGGDGNYSYFLLPELVTPAVLPMQVQPNATTTYDFIVTDGCTTPSASASSTITVFILPQVNFVGDELEGCDPHVTNFTDLTQPTPVSWEWSFGDSDSGVNSATTANPFHAYSGPGLYDVSLAILTADGCVSDNNKTEYIEVFPLPDANFEADPERTNVLEGEINFTDLSVDSIAEWSWDFGTGDLSTEQNPVYTYTDTGTFIVWLQVVTNHGCEDETMRQIEIEPDFMFYVPNAFTPNSDARNDAFRGYGEGVNWDTYEMSIYNRWGEEIFFTNDIDNSWDGSFKGKTVPNEAYVWTINIDDLQGNRHTYRGHVTVLR